MTIIFDFDGTVADDFAQVVQIFYELSGHKDHILTADELERLRGMSILQAAEQLRVHPWKLPYLLVRGRQRMAQRISSVKVQSGMAVVIKQLHAQHHELLIMSSNSKRNIKKFLNQHDLNHEFKAVYGGVGLWGKARVLKRLVKRRRLDPATTWYIGDEVRDVESARQAGLPVIAVSWGFNTAAILAKHQPTQLAAKPADIISLLQ